MGLDDDSIIYHDNDSEKLNPIWSQGCPEDYRIAFSWGNTAQEAYENLCSQNYNPQTYLVERRYAHPQAINSGEDTRIIPHPIPNFYNIAKTPLTF